MVFHVPGWFFMVFHVSRLVFHGFSWLQVGFSWFFSKMYPPKLYPGPMIQSRSAARRAAQDLVGTNWPKKRHKKPRIIQASLCHTTWPKTMLSHPVSSKRCQLKMWTRMSPKTKSKYWDACWNMRLITKPRWPHYLPWPFVWLCLTHVIRLGPLTSPVGGIGGFCLPLFTL